MGALVAIAVGFLVGAWIALLGVRVPAGWIACLVVLAIGMFIAFSARGAPARPGRRSWMVFALLAALVGHALSPPPTGSHVVRPGVVRLEGTVLASWRDDDARSIVEVENGRELASREAIARGARVSVRGLDMPIGTRVQLVARMRANDRFFNPTPHPDWPGARSTDATARLAGRARIAREAPPWNRAAHAVRHALRIRLSETLSGEAALLSRALLLGETSALDSDVRTSVRDAGLSHVLAVSGLHVTLLAGAMVWLLAQILLRVERIAARIDVGRLAKAIGIPLALMYATLVGDAPSAWRAALTAAIGWGIAAIGRRPNPAAVTAAAALVLGALRPDDLGRPGFLLSIVATAALVSSPTPADVGWTRAALTITARTSIATAPIVLWLFGSVPLTGLLANLVVVPIGTILLATVAVHAVFALVLPPLAYASGPIVDVTSRAFFAACEVFASVPLGRDLPPPDVLQGVVLAAAALALLVARPWRARIAIVALALLSIAGAELWLRHREQPSGVRATYLDVGQGDAALIDLPDGRLMIIDAGGATHGGPDPGERVLVPLLRARRRARIDVLVLSHPHPDHYGGMSALLDAFEIGEIWDSGQADAEEADGSVAKLLRRARARGTRIRHPPELCRRERAFGAAKVRVLYPCPRFDPGWGPNDNSLVIELAYAGRRMLFTGDVEAHAESELCALLRPVDVLKVAHHGSRTSSDPRVIDRLHPRIAIASAGRENRFGHPHPQVWERLRARVACPYRTDRNGGVVVTIEDGVLLAAPTRGADCDHSGR